MDRNRRDHADAGDVDASAHHGGRINRRHVHRRAPAQSRTELDPAAATGRAAADFGCEGVAATNNQAIPNPAAIGFKSTQRPSQRTGRRRFCGNETTLFSVTTWASAMRVLRAPRSIAS
jgi:hypothetical protein